MDESTNSCGTRSSSCIQNTENAWAEASSCSLHGTDAAVRPICGSSGSNEAALLRELEDIRALLASRVAGTGCLQQGERLLAVTCLVPGLGPEAWNALAWQKRSRDGNFPWFALELDPRQYPQMLGLYREERPDLGAVCPLTGALLPEAFIHQLTVAVAAVQTRGDELTMALFGLHDACGSDKDSCNAAEGSSCGRDIAYRQKMFPPSCSDMSLCLLMRLVRLHARACDIPGRLNSNRLALLMPGVGPFRARALAERLIASFQEEAARPGDRLRAGLACCDEEFPVTAEQLLMQAASALALAQPGFTRTFRRAGTPEPERRTQVQACEKAFLFFGDAEQI